MKKIVRGKSMAEKNVPANASKGELTRGFNGTWEQLAGYLASLKA
jgi:hypothetical protein